MRLLLLGSSSRGNCALLQAGRGSDAVTVVLDCGLALRTTRELAGAAGVGLARADAVLLSHAHGDHCRSVVPLAQRCRAPLYLHPAALSGHTALGRERRERRPLALEPYRAGRSFHIGPLRCTPVDLPHDADPTHGFVFEADGLRLGFFTDLGDTALLRPWLAEGLDALVLEANHDPELLRQGPYPPFLKDRVAGSRGHLANGQTTAILAEAAPPSLRLLVLAHLSEENNRADLALAAARDGLRRGGRNGVALHAAPPLGPLDLDLSALRRRG